MGRPRIYSDEERVQRNKESKKKWLEANRESVREYCKEYIKDRYYNDHKFKNKAIEYSKKYHREHKEKRREYYKKYYQEHKNKNRGTDGL